MDFGFYKANYRGTLISPEVFDRFLFKAQSYLDNLLCGAKIPEELTTRYNFALCEIAECFFRSCDGEVLSESTDGYSVSYAPSFLEARLLEIARLYLGSFGLLYGEEF